VNAAGGATGADRAACQWLDIDLSSGTPAMSHQGIVFDNAASDPRSYFYPAVITNGQGHAAMAFSGCRADEFVGAYFCSRLAGSAGQMSDVTVLKAGEARYASGDDPQRWGDYSHISIDPLDDMSFWTTQEYAKGPTSSFLWGTWTARLLAPPPVRPSSASPAFIAPGSTGVAVTITGVTNGALGFFDAGPGHTPPSVSISGTGFTVTSLTVNSPTQATITVDVAGGAAAGPRTVTFTNPDGQQATSSFGLVSIDMPTVDLSLTGSPLAENGGVATVTATASFPAPATIGISLSFGGTATGGSDYLASAVGIIIPPGATTGSITLTGQDDLVADPGETVIVTATPVTNALAGSTTQVTAIITDLVPPSASLAVANSPFDEHGGAATLTATLSRTSTLPVTVQLGYGGTAPSARYVALTAITVPAGSLSTSAAITGRDDATNEDDQTVVVSITGVANGVVGAPSQVTAIESHDFETGGRICGLGGAFGMLLAAVGLLRRRQSLA
jgi:hypothetical protein